MFLSFMCFSSINVLYSKINRKKCLKYIGYLIKFGKYD